jgi:general secretion pathway protein F/type IV pilus assembly protein PilC
MMLVIGVPLIAAAAWWITGRPGPRRVLARWQLRMPKLGKLTRGLAVARFSRILGTLLENGIPMLAAMQISRDAAGNVVMAEAIDRATEAVRAGESLARPLGESGLVDEDVLEMIAVGESANNLPDVLITVAETIEKRIDAMLTLFVRLMEPLLLLALGGVVAFIFLALVIPMMRLSAAM